MQSNVHSICIVGTGFRGLGILERVFAYAKQNKSSKPIQVHLVDPATEGPEQYDTRQPDYLLLNIVCGQVSIFPDALSVPGCPPTKGPTLHEWVCDQGLRLAADGFTLGNKGRIIEYGDFLPRRILGEYLLWFREFIKNQAVSLFDIVEHKAKATDFTSDKKGFTIELSNSETIDADYVFITVGQILEPILNPVENKFDARYINQPYPLPDQLESIKSEETIAISGLGLTAFDAILSLTIGRGGKVETKNGIDEYIPCGNEPQIVAFSRSGLPYRSRPSLGAPLKYNPIIFTRSNIDELRKKVGLKLDFDSDILPLMFSEIRVAYQRAKFGRDFGWEKTNKLLDDLSSALVKGEFEVLLSELDNLDSFVFDPKLYYLESFSEADNKNSIALANTVSYENWIRKWLEDDLNESRNGTLLSPLKAALESFREFRDVIRYAVDFGGLTSESSERFFSFHSKTLNRIGVGPQKEHTAIILALMRAGILNVSLGPNPQTTWDSTLSKWKLSSSLLQTQHDVFVDWVYHGSINSIHNIYNDTGIIGAMARKGFLRRLFHENSVIQSVEVDRCLHPISQDGIANEKIWIMGLLCEGVTFYNGYVTSPNRFVCSQFDADCAVIKIFSKLV